MRLTHHLFFFQSWKVNRRTFPWCRPSTRRMQLRWTRRRGWPSAEGSQFYFSCSLSGTSFSDSPVTVQDMHSKFQNGTRSGEQLLEIIFTVIFFFPFLSIINATIQAAIKLRPVTWLISYRFEEVISMCIKSRPRKQGCASSYRYLKIPRGEEKQWPIDHTFRNS